MYIYNEIVPILLFSNKVFSLFCFIFLDQMGPAKIAAFNCQPTLHMQMYMWSANVYVVCKCICGLQMYMVSAFFVVSKLPEILRISFSL